MSRTRTNPESGFYLVEVLAAMALLGFVLTSTCVMLTTAGRANAAARDETTATTLAHDKAETLKRAPYNTLGSDRDTVKVRSMLYDREWIVENNVPYTYMRQVTVTVTPQRKGGHGGNRVAVVRFHRVPA